jgi:1-acyl-sn-glycerol-3-phosphate acyltransferase
MGTKQEPGERRRNLLRNLYAPWVYCVYLPYLGVTTVSFGAVAFLVAKLNPRVSFHIGTIWSWLLCRMNFTKVSIKGRRNAKPGQSYVIISNHQSNFDILAIYGHWGRQFRWVMKEELRKVPGLGWYCEAGGHVFIDRSSKKKAIASLREAKSLLKDGISVIIFPEGTRSTNGRLGKFKKGGFMMALDLDLPILPISVSNSHNILPTHTLRLLPGKIDISIHPPVDAGEYGYKKRAQLIEDVRKIIASGLSPWERGDKESKSE